MIWLYARLLRSPVGELVAAGQTFETLRESRLAIDRDATVPEDLRHAIQMALANASATCKKRNSIVHEHRIAGPGG